MTEFEKPFIEVDESIKLSIEKLLPKHNLISWKKNESVGYDVVQSFKWLISSETISWYAQEDVDELVMYQ